MLGFIAITAAVTNIVSGFLITDRMLKMFKKRRRGEEVMGSFVNYIYIVSAALFILSLKWMNSPATARRGVFAGEIGMLLAIVGTLVAHDIFNWQWILAAFLIGIGDRRSDRVHHADDGGAAADRDVARLRRAGRGAGRHGGVLPAAGDAANSRRS